MTTLQLPDKLTVNLKRITHRLGSIDILYVGVLILLTVSFVYGWYFDSSKPQPIYSWADQGLYLDLTQSLAAGEIPTSDQLHFTVGYPALGLLGYFFSPDDPFIMISFLLLITSASFCYFAARKLVGKIWTAVFMLGLFYWDFLARSFNFAFELFVVPWSNQVLFLVLAYFFWLSVQPRERLRSLWMIVLTSALCGVCIATREETILFCLPILAFHLVVAAPNWRIWAAAAGIVGAIYAPQYAVSMLAVDNGPTPRDSYSKVASYYLQPSILKRNIWEVLIDSRHYGNPQPPTYTGDTKEKIFQVGGPNPNREALFQAAPWLWLGIPGIVLMLISRRYSKRLKAFLVISGLVLAFYLSGANMSSQKLQFHCLRYIAPTFIALNLGVVIMARDTTLYVSRQISKRRW